MTNSSSSCFPLFFSLATRPYRSCLHLRSAHPPFTYYCLRFSSVFSFAFDSFLPAFHRVLTCFTLTVIVVSISPSVIYYCTDIHLSCSVSPLMNLSLLERAP